MSKFRPFPLLALLAAAPPPVSPQVPPLDWSTLPALRLRQPVPIAPALSAFVRDEVAARGCTAAVAGADGFTLTVDMAVLVEGDQLRRIVPRAIDCSTIEQYAAGLVSRFARQNIDPGTPPGWVRTSVTFSWR